MEAKKRFGQNFLTSKKVVEDIVRAGEVGKNDIVLEIGPGRGILTEELLKNAGQVIAIEKDRDLIAFLQKRFGPEIKNSRLLLVEGDIRNFSPQSYNLKAGSWKLVANIPYYITGEIFRQFLESPAQPSVMVLMIQKEVGERIMARNKKESLLSLSVKAYGKPKIIRKVGRGSFNPAPNVDSVVISISNISKKSFKNASEQAFFNLMHLGFAHKRKQLMSNLKEKYPKSTLENIFSALKLNPKIRSEDVPLQTWFLLAENLTN
ncbi:MAG: 16S rRNA (adenine(1518)-N(6)/adenine(1519)-N(6))-dimethyltransferase RsmA [bacterium]|nr:16S rRNA (adenine(1518)-N(6)/adenine(1519)-N(6))-dimethyltransferase RsmA [bacterium]